MSEGSLLLKFMEKLRAEHPGLFTLEVERLPEAAEAAWRRDVASALTVKSVPSLGGEHEVDLDDDLGEDEEFA